MKSKLPDYLQTGALAKHFNFIKKSSYQGINGFGKFNQENLDQYLVSRSHSWK